ncbi:MAG: FHA domain-containing protein [Polyangiaceae bacterium]
MATDVAFKLTIERGQQPPRELTVHSTRVLLGAAAHCEVRIDEADAAPEQLLLEVVDQGIFARSRSRQHGVMVDGIAFSDGPIARASVIQLGQTRVRIELSDDALALKTSARRTKRSVMVHALAAVGFPIGFYLLLAEPEGATGVAKPVEPPRLFEVKPASCSTRVPSEAKLLAESELLLAEAMRERAPFHPEDGVKAVGHYEVAAACFGTATEPETAAQVNADASSLRKSIEESFHVHRARLDYALSTQRYDRARVEIHELLAFLGGSSSDYKTRLKWVDHQIQLKYAKDRSKSQ